MARGNCAATNSYTQGKEGGKLADLFPFSRDARRADRGQQRYNIFVRLAMIELARGRG